MVPGMTAHTLFTSDAIPDTQIDAWNRDRSTEEITAWLPGALAAVEEAADQFGFTPTELLPATTGLVYAGDCDGQKTVLKLVRPDRLHEIEFMVAAQGGKVPAVLEVNRERDIYLIGYVFDTGAEITAVQARELAASLTLPVGTIPGAMPVQEKVFLHLARAHAAVAGYPAIQEADIVLAEQLTAILSDTAPETRILHGDILAKNLIPSDHGLVAIDPEPLIGDPDIDIARYLAWRGHTRTIHDEWASVSTPRVDLWAWVFGVLERNAKDPQRDAREEVIDEFRKDVIRIIAGTRPVPA